MHAACSANDGLTAIDRSARTLAGSWRARYSVDRYRRIWRPDRARSSSGGGSRVGVQATYEEKTVKWSGR